MENEYTSQDKRYARDWAYYTLISPGYSTTSFPKVIDDLHKDRVNTTLEHSRHHQVHELPLSQMDVHVCRRRQLESLNVLHLDQMV